MSAQGARIKSMLENRLSPWAVAYANVCVLKYIFWNKD
jgi:hypothetical protein